MIRTWALVAVLLSLASPGYTAQRISVAELERILAESQSLPDGELAAQLADIQLTERFTSQRLDHWRASLTGPKSQRALLGLADRSAFLRPPAAEIPATAAPDLAQQRRIMGLTATYVSQAIPQLPRFYANRTTVHFEDVPGSGSPGPPSPGSPSQASLNEGGSLHAVGISRTTVVYRDGQEIVEPGPVKVDKAKAPDRGLKTWGVFGPVLGLVLVDAAQNKLAWDHWEEATGAHVAVFRYSVAKGKSHYEVRYCCIASSYGMESNSFQEMSGYHGEIAVDPATGVIVRLTLEAELDANDPISRAAISVEYGPVELGGKTYICPSHSVSISMAKTVRSMKDASGHSWAAMGPSQMLLNHADFDQYHLFRAETRVLSGNEERTAGLAPDATLLSAQPAEMLPAEETLANAPPAGTGNGAAEAGASVAAVAGAEAPEISSSVATGLPDGPSRPTDQAGDASTSGVRLQITARLVDVNVVALDKKGHPVVDLRRENFEVYDNDVKQNVTSFTQASAEAGKTTTPGAPAEPAGEQAFSNHASKDAPAKVAGGNTIIFLIDASNLSFNDLVDARQQMIHFLQALPPDEKVGLYAMRYHGFQVLEEPAPDHALIASRLAKWAPTAQDAGNANDQEQRNRQQIESVHSPEDMLNVNGNYTLDPGTSQEALDPKLREMGSNPGPNALMILVNVAQHLAPMTGHKSLVWVTSDNALADWTRTSVSVEKRSRYIEPIALRTQEAMNNAHVSVYPLNASRLEANVIKADIGNRNVQLTPTFQMPLGNEQMQEGPEANAGRDMNPYNQQRDFGGSGRLLAQMEQDIKPIQGVFREVADATGGRALRRSSDIVGGLNGIVEDGHATYLLGFTPAQPADGQYHLLTVKVVGRHDVTLRYRTGYQYDKEPTTLKDRFRRAIWQPVDASEIGISTRPITDAAGNALRVTVAGSDLDLSQESSHWTGKLDIFLVQRDEVGQRAKVTGRTVGLRLKPATYQHAMNEGLTFDERIDFKPSPGSLRVVVVDTNSGRIGSVTVPADAFRARP